MDKSKRPFLDAFGKLVIEQVRDDACEFLQRVISGRMADKQSRELYKKFRKMNTADADLLERFLVAAVDASLVRFLHFLDVNEIEVLFSEAGAAKDDVRAASDGLAGELYSDQGWISKFSKFSDKVEPLE